MRIDSGTIGMESARSYRASNVTVRRFMITEYQASLTQEAVGEENALGTAVSGEGQEAHTTQEQTAQGQTTQGQTTQGQTTDLSKAALEDWQSRFGMSARKISLRSTSSDTVNDIRQTTLRYIFDMLFPSGRNRFHDWVRENARSSDEPSSLTDAATEEVSNAESNKASANGQNLFGQSGLVLQNRNVFVTKMRVLSYSKETLQIETEETAFSTVGTVKTADGREINFNVNVKMSRQFQQYYKADLESVNFKMCDPLVINLDTDVAELSDQNFYFDIDADGEKDEVAQLSGKSGYLALDKNEDGTINDGNELFGTASGDGFADLAKYDQDGNGWIDEGDAIWSKLKIWCKDENGEDVLYRLADKGVGAICLQNAATDFALKSDEGRTKGAIRNTGIFLYENGNVGTVQHVDVAKYQGQA